MQLRKFGFSLMLMLISSTAIAPIAVQAASFSGLGGLGAPLTNFVYDVSADGSTVVGRSISPGAPQAFIWKSATGMQGIGDLPGGQTSSVANGVSGDGRVVVGEGNDAFFSNEAFVWNATNGMQGLGDLPGGSYSSFASGVSADGSVVVGRGTSASGGEAMIWDAINGLRGMGDLTGGRFLSQFNDVSANGSIVVGKGNGAAGERAVIWDATNGMQELSVFLNALGIDTTGWTLSEAAAISDDGLTIVGTGTNPNGLTEGWIAVIPEPGTALLMGLGLVGLASQRRSA